MKLRFDQGMVAAEGFDPWSPGPLPLPSFFAPDPLDGRWRAPAYRLAEALDWIDRRGILLEHRPSRPPGFVPFPPSPARDEAIAGFLAEFAGLRAGWSAERTTRPVPAGDGLLLPDISFRREGRRTPIVFLEIVGFWTGESLDRRRRLAWTASGAKVILWLDDRLRCSEGPAATDGTAGARVIVSRSPPAPRRVLEVLAEMT
jgi:hypothetical protein